MTKHVAVLMGGWSAEREVSLVTGAACVKALQNAGYDVTPIDVQRDMGALMTRLYPKPDAIFNALHGRYGEDGCVIPRDASILFVRGHSDPVLNPAYVDSWADFLRERTNATVTQRTFASQHAMAVVNEPDRYRAAHAEDLLGLVPEWRVEL